VKIVLASALVCLCLAKVLVRFWAIDESSSVSFQKYDQQILAQLQESLSQ